MNTLLRMFDDSSIDLFSPEDRRDLVACCIRYCFKLIGVAEFKATVSEFDLRNEVWRHKASENSDMFKVKLWMRYIAVHPKKRVAKKFGITNPDDVEIRNVLLNDPELLAEVAGIEGQVFTWKRMQRIMSKLLLDMAPFARKRAHAKLRFLIGDTGKDLADFESELLIHVISGAYAKYPRYRSYLHLQNTARTIINNMSINIIKHHTSQGRKSKYQEVDGTFANNKISLEALTENQASAENLEHHTQGRPNEFHEVEVAHSIRSLCNSPAKATAFKLLISTDGHFSKWLVDNNHTQIDDNARYHERLISQGKTGQYIQHISDYLQVPMRKLMNFFNTLVAELQTA